MWHGSFSVLPIDHTDPISFTVSQVARQVTCHLEEIKCYTQIQKKQKDPSPDEGRDATLWWKMVLEDVVKNLCSVCKTLL